MTTKTIREIALAWKSDKQRYVKQSTYAAYVLVLENHILPSFGDCDALSEKLVQEFVLQKLNGGLSIKTVKDILIVLKMVMKFGVKNEWMNYCEWDIKSREEEIDYAEAHNIPLKINRETNYSKDKNLWHLSHEGLDLENPANEPQYNHPGFLELGVSPEQAPDTPTYVTIHFEKGVPTAVDGKEMGAVELVEYLNKLGGANGIGLLDIVENRLVGMKSRGVYETPGGAILYKAINVLETITLDKESSHFKAQLAQKYADIVYNGQWFTPLREALDAFADSLEKTVTGDVKLKLYKGNMINAGVTSPFTLYDEQTASFGEDEDYNQADAAGFINLFGLSIKERAKLSKSWPKIEG